MGPVFVIMCPVKAVENTIDFRFVNFVAEFLKYCYVYSKVAAENQSPIGVFERDGKWDTFNGISEPTGSNEHCWSD
jgi:hypothetical protein